MFSLQCSMEGNEARIHLNTWLILCDDLLREDSTDRVSSDYSVKEKAQRLQSQEQ